VGLEKATITPEGGESIQVLFNPNKYSLEKGNTLAEIGVPGLGAPLLQFVHGNTRTLAMELFFDTYEARSDVRAYTDRIYGLLAINRDKHAPPICEFRWQSFHFRGVLDRVSGSFDLFLANGTPARATLNVSFKEYIDVEAHVRALALQSADHTRTYTVRRGDTLSGIAATFYRNPAKWRTIALANQIRNPLALAPGQVLVIPPIS
jgi:hypothetical protein